MEFEIKYEQTRAFISSTHRTQLIWLAIGILPLLYLCHVAALVLNWYFGDKNIPSLSYRLWYALVFFASTIAVFIIGGHEVVKRHFRFAKQYPVMLRFNLDGIYSETPFGTSMIKWDAIAKTKRTSRAFIIQITGGNIYIPVNVLSENQTLFIEEKVLTTSKAA